MTRPITPRIVVAAPFVCSLALLLGCPGGDPGLEEEVYVDGDGFPELTAPLVLSGDVANGDTLNVQVPVDADTAQVRLAVEDFATSTSLVQNFSEPGGPSATFSADIEIPIGTSAPSGTYYVTVELCSSVICEDPFKRVFYERFGESPRYGRADFDSPPLTQVGETRDAGISIATFELTNSNE